MSAAVSPATTWADRIRPHLVGAVENILAAGRELNEAKSALPHGTFGPLLDELGLSRAMAGRFMRVAANQVLTKCSPVHTLPAAVSVLDELGRLDDDTLAAVIEAGKVSASTTRQQAKQLAEIIPISQGRVPSSGPTGSATPLRVVNNQAGLFRSLAKGLRATSPLIVWGDVETDHLDQFIAAATYATTTLNKVKQAAERERSRRGSS